MTGIAKILFDTLRTFTGCSTRQKRLHQFLVTLYHCVARWKSVSAALLIILWSTVQVRDALPNTTHELFSIPFMHLVAAL